MGDPQTLWLNLTNVALGVVVLACLLAVALPVIKELFVRRKTSVELDREMKELVAGFESNPHILDVPGLGVTMADGGEVRKPEDPK